jgi:CRP-like cAMP-binding protein
MPKDRHPLKEERITGNIFMEELGKEVLQLVMEHPLFQGLNESQISKLLSQSNQIHCQEDYPLIHEGCNDKRCYLVLDGELEVLKVDAGNREHRLAVIPAGEVIGAVVLLDDKMRSASVRCLTDCSLLVIEQAIIEDLISKDKDYYKIIKNLGIMVSDKLRATNEIAVNALQEKVELYRVQVIMSRIMVWIILALSFLSFFNTTAVLYINKVSSTTYFTAPLMVFLTLFLISTMKIVKLPLSAYGLTLRGGKAAVVGSLLYCLPICVLIMMTKWFLIHYNADYQGQNLFQLYNGRAQGNVGAWLVDALLYAVLICPFQEFMARSGLQAPLQHLFTGPRKILFSIVASNIIFMTAHVFISSTVAVMVFVPGLFFGWLFYRYKTLLAPITGHIVVGLWGICIVGFF